MMLYDAFTQHLNNPRKHAALSKQTHTYKGYTIVVYGHSSMSIKNASGKEVFHTGHRTKKVMNTKDMENAINDYIHFTHAVIEGR